MPSFFPFQLWLLIVIDLSHLSLRVLDVESTSFVIENDEGVEEYIHCNHLNYHIASFLLFLPNLSQIIIPDTLIIDKQLITIVNNAPIVRSIFSEQPVEFELDFATLGENDLAKFELYSPVLEVWESLTPTGLQIQHLQLSASSSTLSMEKVRALCGQHTTPLSLQTIVFPSPFLQTAIYLEISTANLEFILSQNPDLINYSKIQTIALTDTHWVCHQILTSFPALRPFGQLDTVSKTYVPFHGASYHSPQVLERHITANDSPRSGEDWRVGASSIEVNSSAWDVSTLKQMLPGLMHMSRIELYGLCRNDEETSKGFPKVS